MMRPLTRRSVLLGAAATTVTNQASAELTPKVAIGKDGWMFPAWEDLRHTSLQRSRQIGDIVSVASSILRQAGIETVVVMTPMKARIYGDFLPPEFQPNADWQRRYAQISEDWRKAGILVPDLVAYFTTQRTAQSEALYFKADIHWTPTGADLAAQEVARQIKEKRLLGPSPKPGLKLGPYFVTRYGQNDLARLLPEAEFKNYPFQNMRLRRPAGKANTLLDDDAGDVAVLGNSYMLADYTFPTVLSNQLDRPVSLMAKVARSPYALLLDYLDSPAFRQMRAKVIVWHMMEGNMEVAPDNAPFWNSGAMSAVEFHGKLRQLVARA